MSMFSKATRSFVRQIEDEAERSLIHVSRLNDSHKLVPMRVVVKRNRFWFWQRPKYQPSGFNLGHLLLGDATLNPVVSEFDFLSCEGMFGDHWSGSLTAGTGMASVDLEGVGSSKLKLSFGKLIKQEVNEIQLHKGCSDRLVDMKHRLVQQVQKRNEVLAVLKERVLTTTPCVITETQNKQGTCQGALGILRKLGGDVKISVKDSASLEVDSDVSLEIPAATVIAYCLIELEIKKDGHFQLCLQPGTCGGFEADAVDNLCELDGIHLSKIPIPKGAPLSALNSGVCHFEMD